MEVFRIAREKYSTTLTSSKVENRWNVTGQEIIYTGSSRALSTVEVLVHQKFIKPVFTHKVMVIHIPDDFRYIRTISANELPSDWRFPTAYPALQKIGSNWYRSKESLILQVPSAVITAEYNYLINVLHPDFNKNVSLVTTEDYFWDDRLSPLIKS